MKRVVRKKHQESKENFGQKKGLLFHVNHPQPNVNINKHKHHSHEFTWARATENGYEHNICLSVFIFLFVFFFSLFPNKNTRFSWYREMLFFEFNDFQLLKAFQFKLQLLRNLSVLILFSWCWVFYWLRCELCDTNRMRARDNPHVAHTKYAPFHVRMKQTKGVIHSMASSNLSGKQLIRITICFAFGVWRGATSDHTSEWSINITCKCHWHFGEPKKLSF